jgi:transcriptional regulator
LLYNKPEFAPLTPGEVFDMVDRLTFATMITHGRDGLQASHLNFMLDRERGPHGTLVSHMAVANDHAALVAEQLESLVIFQGPHGYISSSWYPAAPARDSAPTWNFAVIHCHGRPVPLSHSATARHLADLVTHMERGRPEEWRLRELGPGGMERRLPRILGFELAIDRLEAKFKMGQDERFLDTRAAIARLADGIDPELALLMEKHNRSRTDGP